MSLRTRLLLAIAGALLASFLAGAALSLWQAARLTHVELSAALATGAQSVAGALQSAGGAPDGAALRRLVASFDGSLHVTAELMEGGETVARSRPAPAAKSPTWFARLATPDLKPRDFPLGASTSLRLSPVPASEIGERWADMRRLVLLLAVFSVLAAVACLATVAIGLQPLRLLAGAFATLEQGAEGSAVPETGPTDIAALSSAFNRMQQALRLAAQENRRLSAQLARLAEEERAELARDLHDEAGPLLFAITAWAAAARLHAAAGEAAEAAASLGSLEAAAAELQQSLRDLLRRLRDSAPAAIDLRASVEELLEFWRDIKPNITFSLDVPPAVESAPDEAKAALFRVAQEGISNAVRHAAPSRVSVVVGFQEDGLALSVEDDGAGGAKGDGFGLVGMEERLKALGGTLDIRRDRGWRLTAWMPACQDTPP